MICVLWVGKDVELLKVGLLLKEIKVNFFILVLMV